MFVIVWGRLFGNCFYVDRRCYGWNGILGCYFLKWGDQGDEVFNTTNEQVISSEEFNPLYVEMEGYKIKLVKQFEN